MSFLDTFLLLYEQMHKTALACINNRKESEWTVFEFIESLLGRVYFVWKWPYDAIFGFYDKKYILHIIAAPHFPVCLKHSFQCMLEM